MTYIAIWIYIGGVVGSRGNGGSFGEALTWPFFLGAMLGRVAIAEARRP
jgi:hypothetical protein